MMVYEHTTTNKKDWIIHVSCLFFLLCVERWLRQMSNALKSFAIKLKVISWMRSQIALNGIQRDHQQLKSHSSFADVNCEKWKMNHVSCGLVCNFFELRQKLLLCKIHYGSGRIWGTYTVHCTAYSVNYSHS